MNMFCFACRWLALSLALTALYACGSDAVGGTAGDGGTAGHGGAVTAFYYVEQSGVFDGFEFSSDSQRVVYTADQDSNGVAELYASDLGGANNVKLSAAPPQGHVVESDFVVQ